MNYRDTPRDLSHPIQREFIEGINEVFTLLFNTGVMYHLMDEDMTVPDDPYMETDKKYYKEPVDLAAKVETNFKKDELPEMTVSIDAIITVPTFQMIKYDLPRHTTEDLNTLKRGYFSYKQVEHYSIELVRPKTLVDDEWQIYEFFCYVPKGGADSVIVN